jgi:hypothetical protein
MGVTNPPGVQQRRDIIQDAQTMMNHALPKAERDAAADRFVQSFSGISSNWGKDSGGYMSADDVRKNVNRARDPNLTPEQKASSVEALARAATANPYYNEEVDRLARAARVISETVHDEQLNRVADATIKKAMTPSVFPTDPNNEVMTLRNTARMLTNQLDVEDYNNAHEKVGLKPRSLVDRMDAGRQQGIASTHGMTTDGIGKTLENMDRLAQDSFNGDTSEATRFMQRLQTDESSARYFRDIPRFNHLNFNDAYNSGILHDMARLDQQNPEAFSRIIDDYNNGRLSGNDDLKKATGKAVSELGPAPPQNLGDVNPFDLLNTPVPATVTAAPHPLNPVKPVEVLEESNTASKDGVERGHWKPVANPTSGEVTSISPTAPPKNKQETVSPPPERTASRSPAASPQAPIPDTLEQKPNSNRPDTTLHTTARPDATSVTPSGVLPPSRSAQSQTLENLFGKPKGQNQPQAPTTPMDGRAVEVPILTPRSNKAAAAPETVATPNLRLATADVNQEKPDRDKVREALRSISSNTSMMPETESLHPWAQSDAPAHKQQFDNQWDNLGDEGQTIAATEVASIQERQKLEIRPSLDPNNELSTVAATPPKMSAPGLG